MNKQKIEAIAEYFTKGSRVMMLSSALKAGGPMAEEAGAFFALRSMLGIEGYPTTSEAVRILSEPDDAPKTAPKTQKRLVEIVTHFIEAGDEALSAKAFLEAVIRRMAGELQEHLWDDAD